MQINIECNYISHIVNGVYDEINVNGISEPTFSRAEVITSNAVTKAVLAICKYTGWNAIPHDESISSPTGYDFAVISLAIAYIREELATANALSGKKEITQMSQGSRSVSYSTGKSLDSEGLTADVRAVLPVPKIRVL